MKKAIVFLLTMVLIFSFGLQSVAFAEEPISEMEVVAEQAIVVEEAIPQATEEQPEPEIQETSGDYEYGINSDGSVTITKYNGSEYGHVSIPATLDGRKVTSIGTTAFFRRESITGVDIPEGVTSIGHSAFWFCRRMTGIKLPSTLKVIGEAAFSSCVLLESVDIPPSVTTIEAEAFRSCYNITNVNMPGGVTSIGDEAFWGCSLLTTIKLPEGLKTIGDEAFNGCSELTSVQFPSTLTSIGSRAFETCSKLTSVSIPANVSSLGSYAFNCCYELKQVTLPSSITAINEYTFNYCTKLAEITIPSGVKSIDEGAFAYCTALTKAVIPASVTSIKRTSDLGYVSGAFYKCAKLTIYGKTGSAAQDYATADGIPFVSTDDAKAPAAPTGVKAGSAAYNKLKVTWSKVSGATGYNIYRSSSKDGKYTKVGTATANSYAESGLITGTLYYYKVAATASGTEGKLSSAASAKPIVAAPKSPKAIASGSKAVKLTWTKPTGASGYFIYRSTAKDGTYKNIKNVGSALSYTDKSLTSGKTYYYKIVPYRTVSGKKIMGKGSAIVYANAK